MHMEFLCNLLKKKNTVSLLGWAQLLNCQTQSHFSWLIVFPLGQNSLSKAIWCRRGFPPFQATFTQFCSYQNDSVTIYTLMSSW